MRGGIAPSLPISSLLAGLWRQPQFCEHVLGEVLRPAGGGDHAVGHGLTEFGFGGACLLRDREVFGQSVGTADCHGTADPDQFAGFGIEDFLISVVEKFRTAFHVLLLVLG